MLVGALTRQLLVGVGVLACSERLMGFGQEGRPEFSTHH
jgi:hypothetical protein